MLASAVVVGDEILSGHVQDQNAHFLASRLAEHGHRMLRAVVVGDDPVSIADELRRDVEGPAHLVFVCGGLGPTHDDRTMEGVALALGRALEPCRDLVVVIEELIERVGGHDLGWDAFGIDGLRKMALAPSGAEVLTCSIGVVPAVTVADERARVVVLPGPPRELQAVVLECVEPRYLEGTGERVHREAIEHPFPESTLADLLGAIQRRYPRTTIGSYPQADRVLLRIAGPEHDVEAVAVELRTYIQTLADSPAGVRLLEVLGRIRRTRDA